MPIINVPLAVSLASFRADFPEFKDENKYTDYSLQFWLAVATVQVNACRFGDLYPLGVELYAAHNVLLEARAVQEGLAGGFPGVSRGPINAQTVGEVTLNYDTTIGLEEGAGTWNQTLYGARLYRLIQIFGAGPVQVGPGCGGGISGIVPGFSGDGPAWSGPNCKPGIFGS